MNDIQQAIFNEYTAQFNSALAVMVSAKLLEHFSVDVITANNTDTLALYLYLLDRKEVPESVETLRAVVDFQNWLRGTAE